MERTKTFENIPMRQVRWRRTVWAPDALALLTAEYERSPIPTATRLRELATTLAVPSRNVRIWFQNRRQRGPSSPSEVRSRRRSMIKSRSWMVVPAVPMRGAIEDPVVEQLRCLVRYCIETDGHSPNVTDVSSMARLLHLDDAYVTLMVSHLLSHAQSR